MITFSVNSSMIKRTFLLFFLILPFLLVNTDARPRRKKRFNCSEKIAKSMQYYKKKHYNKVKTILNEVKIQCSGHASMDSALYYLGRSFLGTKQSTEARMEFEVLIQDFPNSVFHEEANFLLGYCSYKESAIYERDQTETREAIREFSNFLDNFPKSTFVDSAQYYMNECLDKLAKKEFMAARFYEKVDQYDAAITYYRLIIKNYPESKYNTECRLGLAQNLIKTNRMSEAVKSLETLLSLKISDEIKNKAQALLNRITEKQKTMPPPEDKKSDSESTEKPK